MRDHHISVQPDGWEFSARTRQGLRDKVKVIIGGAPVSKKYAEQIGADGYGNDAAQAVKLVRSLL